MSMLLINVTDIPGASTDDEVVLIGKQKNNQITVGSFSDLSNMLNYEVLVRLPSEIPRVVVD
jgi:alanine racemase